MSESIRKLIVNGEIQSAQVYGRKVASRTALRSGRLNVRNQGTIKQLDEWIFYYQKRIDEGNFCPIRGQKLIAHFTILKERKENKLKRNNE